MSAPLLTAEEIVVRFGGVVALDGVDFTADARAITGLVGPNGAGKTTLFGILSGLLRPRAGRVSFDGTDITRASPQRRSRLGIARTFQRLELFGEMTVREHLVVAHRVRMRRDRSLLRDLVGLGSRPTLDEDETIAGILELVGLDAVAEQPVILLPLGTGRIVEIARALATAPRIVLLDEPTSGLDVHETEQVASALRAARDDRGVAFVVVEHDVELVLELCEAITVLDFGRVIARGTPSEIRASTDVQTAYLGTRAAEDVAP
ncbi:MAG: ABC transporter ATP-binding protein [Actinobacteria bacterium]|nr:ABC transporter ATP-binding protein [Actinomycetota bacterium]